MLGSANIIAFVPVTDFATAKAFYEGTLGLRFVKEDGFALVLDANGITLRVVKLQKFEPVQYTVLGWEVKGIQSIVLQLQQKGVTFERYDFFKQDDLGIWTNPNGDKVAWFKDPDGNTLSVSEHV
jgi:catechol 2,3-dioxygenase-like lactoylglutathione lyase family enzyme